MQRVWTNKPTEIGFTAGEDYSDIFNQAELDVVFTGSSGESWRVPGFWAGGQKMAVRFAAPSPGVYRWRSECANAADAGLHGRRGEFEALPYEGACELYRRGRLQVARNRRCLEHADGTPFLWLGDTWWMGLSTRLDWPDGFRRLVEDRVRKGFTVIQIVAGPLPQGPARIWDRQQTNEAGWSWECDFARINPRYYDLADLRLAYMIEQGLMPCILGMWGYHLPFMGIDRCIKHWRNLVARYSAYPVAFCAAGEMTMTVQEQTRQQLKEGWTQVTRHVRKLDAFGNILTVHPETPPHSGRVSFDAQEGLLDLDMLQTGHSGSESLKPTVIRMQEAVSRRPRLPVINGEVCYEGISGGSKDEVQRFLFWSSMLQGACGHTYGAQGVWGMSSRDEPYRTRWGEGHWQDAMHYPGSVHVGIGAKILRRYEWQLLEPCGEQASEDGTGGWSFVARIPGKLIIAYLPCNYLPSVLRGDPLPLSIEPEVNYHAMWVNPRTGEEVAIGAVVAVDGQWTPGPAGYATPTKEDWLLILESR